MGCGGSSINYEVFKGSKRGQMRLKGSYDEDFLTHHLSNEASLSQYASTDAIRKRQIIEHLMVDQMNARIQCDFQYSYFYVSSVLKSWMQRLFVSFLEEMDEDYFNRGKSYDVAREKLADRYLFEIYQIKEFFHAGTHKIKDKGIRDTMSGIGFIYIAINSDSALFPMIKFLKEKYPQVADNASKAFPDVKEIKQDANLLSHFASKYISDPKYMNIATTTLDLKFLFDTAFGQFQDFKEDMQDLLGIDVLADVKVKCIDTENGRTYNASSTRRVLIKWVETLLQKIPEQIETQAFVNFLVAKTAIVDNFHVKSTVETETTHNTIIGVLLNLIEDLKVNSKTGNPEPRFGFFIYDLLRCKTHREDGNGVVELIEKMKSTKTTKSGKKLQVLRIKNRLKTPNRDVMVNFKYGDIIVAEAQLGIDSSKVSEKDKKTNKFNHYLYELQRGLFGPTIELIMQYQDFNRKDVIVDLKIEDTVVPRVVKKSVVEKIDRKCPVGHQMIMLNQNYFIYLKNLSQEHNNLLTLECDYCMRKDIPFSEGFDYCYKCSLSFCKNCREHHKKSDPKKVIFSINQKIPKFNSKEELQKAIKENGYYIAVFVDEVSSISELTTDFLAYLNSFFINKMSVNIKFGTIDGTKGWGKQYAKDMNVSRFPTFIAYDRNGKPRKRMIGASLLHIDWFSNYAELLVNPEVRKYDIGCAQHFESKLQMVNVENVEGWVCRLCKNVESIDSFGGLLRSISQGNDVAFQCREAHSQVYQNEVGDQQKDSNFVCKNCAYLACEDDSITFLDVTGKSYLSSKLQKDISKQCKNGHPVEHIHKNPQDNYKLVCSDCDKIFIFSKQDGIGYCKTCNYIMDPKCLGLEITDLDKDRVQRELVSHFAEMTACELPPCFVCFRLYSKQYSSPKPVKFVADPDGDSDFNAIEEALFAFNDTKWKCYKCKKHFKCDTLHIACNYCQVECCIECAAYIFNETLDQFQPEPAEKPSTLSCPSGHQTVRTNEAPDTTTTKFQCESCKTWFTINTPNNWCKTCNHRYCKLCGPLVLKSANASCNQGHQLHSKINMISDYLPCSLNPNHIIHEEVLINGRLSPATIYYCQPCKFYACDPNRCKQPLKICSKNHVLRIKKELSMQKFCMQCRKFIDPLSYNCRLCDQDLCFSCYKLQQNGDKI